MIPLHNAASYGHIEIAQLLLDAGSHVNANDRWQFTPLHEAAQKGRTQLCALLLSHGSNPFVKNQDGQTPFEVASQEDIRCLLRDAMIAENGVGVSTAQSEEQSEREKNEEKYQQLKKMIDNIELGKYYDVLRKEEITIDILGKRVQSALFADLIFSRNEPQ